MSTTTTEQVEDSNILILRGTGTKTGNPPWEWEVVNAPLSCSLCDNANVDWNSPKVGWQLHTGRPICPSCMHNFRDRR